MRSDRKPGSRRLVVSLAGLFLVASVLSTAWVASATASVRKYVPGLTVVDPSSGCAAVGSRVTFDAEITNILSSTQKSGPRSSIRDR